MARKIGESAAKYGPITGRPGQSINSGPHTVIPPLKPDKGRTVEKKGQPAPKTKGNR